MRRPRLRHTTGCLRCKRRRKKCDESGLVCTYCARWGLECVWPRDRRPPLSNFAASNGPDRATTLISRSRIPSSTISTSNVPNIDPFHSLPLKSDDNLSLGPKYFHAFFVAITNANIPSDSASTRNELAAGWLESIHEDELACYAFATYATKCTLSRVSSADDILSLSLESRTLRLLRSRIQSEAVVTENLLLAASVYFMAAALDSLSRLELRRMLTGINALVRSCGGFGHITQTMKSSTVLSVLICDIFNSLVNAELHYFAALEKPCLPPTFETVYETELHGINLSQYFSEDIAAILNDLDFLLFFRHPSRQNRGLLPTESQYLSALARWLDYQIGILQHHHLNTGSLSETALLAMLIAKQEVFADRTEHSIIISTVLDRLKTAMWHCQTQDLPMSQTVSMWASIVALVGRTVLPARSFFFIFIRSTLRSRYGQQAEWPETWHVDLRIELKQILWHERIDRQFSTICKVLTHEDLTKEERLWYDALGVPIQKERWDSPTHHLLNIKGGPGATKTVTYS